MESAIMNNLTSKFIYSNKKYISFYIFIFYQVFFLLSFFALGYTGRDDSHITYYVSDQLAKNNVIVNYSGEIIEQSSSLFLSFILAIASLFSGFSSADLGPIVSIAMLEFFLLSLIFVIKRYKTSWLITLSTMSVPLIYWSFSGMETSLYVLILLHFLFSLHGFYEHRRNIWALYLFLSSALVALTRPEGLLVVPCVVFGIYCILFTISIQGEKKYIIPFNRPAAIVAIGLLSAVVLRLGLGLNVFPNPVYAKQNASFLENQIIFGFRYISESIYNNPMTFIIFTLSFSFSIYKLLIHIFSDCASRRENIFLYGSVCVVVATGSFAILSGGDWMEYSRFFVPTFVFSIICFFIFVKGKYSVVLAHALLFSSILEILLVMKGPLGGSPMVYYYDYRAKNFTPSFWEKFSRIHSRDIYFIDKFIPILENDRRYRITIASIQAGMVPYYVFNHFGNSKKLRFIDLLGLASNEVHDCLQWYEDPYRHWSALTKCVGKKFDYIFDLDASDWRNLRELEKSGCRELFKEEFIYNRPFWKDRYTSNEFLVDCRDMISGAS